jgi:putative CocE/NonD family hydrolase
MRDGTKLSSDIYLPDAQGRFPTIIMRTPYSTVEGFQKAFSDEARFFASNGYVYLIQDCRGKNDSDGRFHPFHDDGKDGYDTQAWCAKQEWFNGRIGTIGASYSAWNQWATAALKPPHLRAMICTVALPDPVINVPFQNGALVLWMAQWMAMVEGKKNTSLSIYTDLSKIYEHLPLKSMDEAFGRRSEIWQRWMKHPSADYYWKSTFYEDKFHKIDVPVMHISGWYDDDIIGTHLNYVGMTTSKRNRKSHPFQKLIIGPWQHHVNSSRRLGEIDFGESALIDLQSLKLRWFDYWLKDENNGICDEPPVDIFVMGENVWRKEKEWPLKRTKNQEYYFHSNGKANTVSGDGLLDTTKPSRNEPADHFDYDPMNPCPNIYDDSSGAAEGPYDQRPIEGRDDVLVYSTPKLDSSLEVSGRITAKLHCSTSVKDTDFWVQLVDVFPNGYSMHVTDGIIRGRYRESLEKAKLLTPGRIYEFNIDLWVTSNVFLKDHRIRIDVSSSSFPKYDRNPNTGHRFGMDAKTIIAHQTIYHDPDHSSHIVLPIVTN